MTKKSTKMGKRQPAKSRTTTNSWFPKIGESICIRTVTHIHVGLVTEIDRGFIALDRAAWVADTGRFAAFLRDGTVSEVEPFGGPCVVNLGSVIDIAPWKHALLEVVK